MISVDHDFSMPLSAISGHITSLPDTLAHLNSVAGDCPLDQTTSRHVLAGKVFSVFLTSMRLRESHGG